MGVQRKDDGIRDENERNREQNELGTGGSD